MVSVGLESGQIQGELIITVFFSSFSLSGFSWIL